MMWCYYDVVLQGKCSRVVQKRVLGVGLIMVHCYYGVALQGNSFWVV
jgi:hypothetical protein